MIIYNVTISVDRSVMNDWLQWMKEVHIPEIMETNLFNSYSLLRVMNDDNNPESLTYAVQYKLPSLEHYHNYQNDFAPAFRQKHEDRYGDRAISFRTLLEEVL
jgi:hypothetical protein